MWRSMTLNDGRRRSDAPCSVLDLAASSRRHATTASRRPTDGLLEAVNMPGNDRRALAGAGRGSSHCIVAFAPATNAGASCCGWCGLAHRVSAENPVAHMATRRWVR